MRGRPVWLHARDRLFYGSAAALRPKTQACRPLPLIRASTRLRRGGYRNVPWMHLATRWPAARFSLSQSAWRSISIQQTAPPRLVSDDTTCTSAQSDRPFPHQQCWVDGVYSIASSARFVLALLRCRHEFVPQSRVASDRSQAGVSANNCSSNARSIFVVVQKYQQIIG